MFMENKYFDEGSQTPRNKITGNFPFRSTKSKVETQSDVFLKGVKRKKNDVVCQ